MAEFNWTVEDIERAQRDFSYNFMQLDCIRTESYDVAIDCMTECVEHKNKAAYKQPVKRGYWKDIMMSEATGWDLSLTGGRDAVLETVCSVCGVCCAFGGDGEDYLSPYCPNCGADMRGDKNG